jgi:hypothetical protein
MPAKAEAIDQLTQYISGLEPERVASELEPVLQYGGRSLLVRTVKSSSFESSDEILGEVSEAIGKVTSQKEQDVLADRAVGSITDLLRGDEEHRERIRPAGIVVRLAAHGQNFANLINNPRDRAWQLMYLADAVSQQIPGRDNVKAQAELTTESISLLDSAAEAARHNDEDPAYQLQHVAERAAGNIANAREFTDKVSMDDPEFQPVYLRLADQHMELYKEAIEAADSIEDPNERYKQKATIAASMAESNAVTTQGLFSTNARLLEMVRTQVAEVIEAYTVGSEVVDLTAAQKSRELVDLGLKLAAVIDEKYESADQDVIIQRNVGSFIKDLLHAACTNAQSIRKPRNPLKSRLQYEDKVRDAGYYAAGTATRLLDKDFDAALEVYAVAFDLEQVEEQLDPGRHNRHDVIGMIDDNARKRGDVKQGFALLLLADRLERSRLPEGMISHQLQVNARVGLQYLAEAEANVDKTTEIEKIEGGADFVKWMVRVATTDEHTSWRYKLNLILMNHINDPALRRVVEGGLETIVERERQAREPKSEAARLAEQIAGPR